jgi:hypothetical protein
MYNPCNPSTGRNRGSLPECPCAWPGSPPTTFSVRPYRGSRQNSQPCTAAPGRPPAISPVAEIIAASQPHRRRVMYNYGGPSRRVRHAGAGTMSMPQHPRAKSIGCRRPRRDLANGRPKVGAAVGLLVYVGREAREQPRARAVGTAVGTGLVGIERLLLPLDLAAAVRQVQALDRPSWDRASSRPAPTS